MPERTRREPVTVAGYIDELTPTNLPDNELNIIKNLTEGVETPADWKKSILCKVMYTLPAPMGLVCADGYMLAANRELQTFTGYSEAELNVMRFDNFTRPQDRLPDRTNFTKLLAGEIDHYRMEKGWRTRSGLDHFGTLVVVRIPWPKELVAATRKMRREPHAEVLRVPVALAVILDNKNSVTLDYRDPALGNRKLFGVIPEWAIERISSMTPAQNISLVLVLGALVSIVGLLLNFIPQLIQVITK